MPEFPIKVDTSKFETIEDAEECDQSNESRYLEKVANFQSTQLRLAYRAEFEQAGPHLSRAVQNDFPEIELDLYDRIMNICNIRPIGTCQMGRLSSKPESRSNRRECKHRLGSELGYCSG